MAGMARILYYPINHSHRGLLSTTTTTRFTMIMIFLMFFNLRKYIQ